MLWGPVLITAEWPRFLHFTADLFCGGGKFNSLSWPGQHLNSFSGLQRDCGWPVSAPNTL